MSERTDWRPRAEAGAGEALGAAERLIEDAAKGLALACSRGGRLAGELADQHQAASYDLAFAKAEILAARGFLDEAAGRDFALDRALAVQFAAHALCSARTRLEPHLGELGLEAERFEAVFAGPEAAAAIRGALSGAALEESGAAVIAERGDVGRVTLDEDKQLMRDAFQRLGEDVVAPWAEKIHREDLTVPEDILGPMREMGVFGLSVPEKFGGSAPDEGEDNLTMITVTETLSHYSLAAAGSLITRPEIMTRAILKFGTDAQKHELLPQIASGEMLCGIAITEPDYGSDVASLSLKGEKAEGGWKLNGAKTWCTFAGKAQLLFVVTRTDPDKSKGHKGLSLMLVEKPSYDGHDFEYVQDGGGKLTGRAIPTIGYRGMHSFDMAFEDFFVPDNRLLGEEDGLGKGFYAAVVGLTGGRLQTSARACGVMRAAIEAAVAYALDRKVFGAPLADYQLTRTKLAGMAAQYAACRTLMYAVGRRLNGNGDPMEASLIKLLACRAAEEVTRDALQIFGGMGYAEETAVSRYFVDARVLSIFEGAEETLALKVIARQLMERALEAA